MQKCNKITNNKAINNNNNNKAMATIQCRFK